MKALLMGVDREHLESAISAGLGRGPRLVSFGTQLYPDPLSYPTDIPAFFYEVRADAMPFATYGGTFVRYSADDGTAEFQRRLDETRPPTTLARRDPSLAEEQQEPWWNGYLFFTDLEKLPQPMPLSQFTVGKGRLRAPSVRRPLIVDLPQ